MRLVHKIHRGLASDLHREPSDSYGICRLPTSITRISAERDGDIYSQRCSGGTVALVICLHARHYRSHKCVVDAKVVGLGRLPDLVKRKLQRSKGVRGATLGQ